MGNKATKIEEQIQLLKDRGMVLEYPEEKVKELLLDIGYYRLGFYWNPFEIDDKHNFKSGTTFKNVVKLYYLDFDLRNLLTRYLTRIEINFKTKLIYYVSNQYNNSPTWFVDNQVMNSIFINSFDKHYNEKFIRNNKPIKKHHEKYINDRYAPAWKTLEFFTFGTVLTIYKNLKDEEIKKIIANDFGVLNIKKFINLMETVVLLRNYCAHGDVLFDLRTPKAIAVFPEIKFEEDDRSSLNACIKVILYILGKVSENRKNDLKNELKMIFENLYDNEELKIIIHDCIKYRD
ncbi:MAG: Abi family protein [Flavobacteriales bacterium]|nr:MAG: Abi family protein [Flavobacteriales bacterium]